MVPSSPRDEQGGRGDPRPEEARTSSWWTDVGSHENVSSHEEIDATAPEVDVAARLKGTCDDLFKKSELRKQTKWKSQAELPPTAEEESDSSDDDVWRERVYGGADRMKTPEVEDSDEENAQDNPFQSLLPVAREQRRLLQEVEETPDGDRGTEQIGLVVKGTDPDEKQREHTSIHTAGTFFFREHKAIVVLLAMSSSQLDKSPVRRGSCPAGRRTRSRLCGIST